MINAQQLVWRAGQRTLVNGIDLQLKPGELVAVLGANGAGKSSLLKILSGQWPLQSGTVEFDGQPLSDFSRADLAKVRAVMPQSSPLSFPFRVWEVVALGRTPYGRKRKAVEKKLALERLRLTGTVHLAERLFPTLSGGEMQRVQLARVLHQLLSSPAEHRYLFLDECTASLDPAHQHQVFQLVRQLTAQKIGVFAIVHDINLAAQYADRVLLMKAGRPLVLGPVKESLTPARVAEAFALRTHCLVHPEADWPLLVAQREPVEPLHR
ncbi:heme ABC transporter ATP-binding protein [Saccharospirillum mangrovi]|uniref:heme ABC transporter ATP-binding protein n=1 Tax=Saccharospirillum mangrovi TaxID=2161747 RepID=UPI000D3B4997|nr:heme ABC transporter ATP-binding protein [Saccharospirillum mangrovi]